MKNLKPKLVIELDAEFTEELENELAEYKKQGTLEKYGINNYELDTNYKKVKSGDIIEFHTKDNRSVYCKVNLCMTLKNKTQIVNMYYIDFK